jgi:1-acyl-sn-glycerol-3-phosphate acyltransferase
LKTDKPLLPVLIDGTGDVLPKNGLTFRINKVIRIKVLDPIFPGQFGTGDPEELAARVNSLMREAMDELRRSPDYQK